MEDTNIIKEVAESGNQKRLPYGGKRSESLNQTEGKQVLTRKGGELEIRMFKFSTFLITTVITHIPQS